MITVCLTSCNRWNLLQITIDSFLKLNKYPISRYIINEDSGNPEILEKIRANYGHLFEIHYNDQNQGLLQSVDKLYNLVETEFIMHLEDDWLFEGNPHFIQESLTILQQNPNIHQVWIRNGIPDSWLERSNNKIYRMVKSPHLGVWTGFSFNPGVRRLSDYKKFFPNGMNEFRDINSTGKSELNCNNKVAAEGYRAALLLKPACKHIGESNSTWK